jgi:hypothetical protein
MGRNQLKALNGSADDRLMGMVVIGHDDLPIAMLLQQQGHGGCRSSHGKHAPTRVTGLHRPPPGRGQIQQYVAIEDPGGMKGHQLPEAVPGNRCRNQREPLKNGKPGKADQRQGGLGCGGGPQLPLLILTFLGGKG